MFDKVVIIQFAFGATIAVLLGGIGFWVAYMRDSSYKNEFWPFSRESVEKGHKALNDAGISDEEIEDIQKSSKWGILIGLILPFLIAWLIL